MRKVPSFIKDCEAFLADAPSPCFILDRRGRVLWANPGGERLFGEDSPTLTGRPLEEVFSRADALLQRMRSRKDIDPFVETGGSLFLVDGISLPVSIRLQRVRTGARRTSYIAWVSDERELQELRTRLDHSEKLSAMAILAGKVAHEMRTPLNSIFLNNDLLQDRVGKMRGAQGQKLKRYLGILQEEVERLDEIIRSYLSLARLAGSDRQATEVESFLEDFIGEIRVDYARRGISIATAFRSTQKQIPLNQRQFRRVMLNLFANSRDAMKVGGVITVSTEDSTGGYRITVSDNGEGIPPESLSQLTAPFTTRKVNGSGLGLYLTREIVEHHGGRLDIQSIRGEGTSVIITLPAKQNSSNSIS